jgi:hypothetical protein
MEQFSNRLKIHDDTGPMQYNVARWTQFCVIFKKSSTCILRDQVKILFYSVAYLFKQLIVKIKGIDKDSWYSAASICLPNWDHIHGHRR